MFRVDLKSELSKSWMEYTGRQGAEREFAESLFEHLRRNKATARVVDLATGKVIKETTP